MAIVWNIVLLLLLVFVLAVGGLIIAALAPSKDDRLEQARRDAALDEARERAAAREADDRLRHLHRWAQTRAREDSRRERGEHHG